MIDDYLFISTDISKARGFLDMMDRGHPEYGCFIARDKSMTNFGHDLNATQLVDDTRR